MVRHGPRIQYDGSSLISSKGAGSKFPKSRWYNVLQAGRKFDLFAEQDEAVHSASRRLVARIYALDNLKNLEPYVDAAISNFLSKMRQMQGTRIDMGKWLQLFAFGTNTESLQQAHLANLARHHW